MGSNDTALWAEAVQALGSASTGGEVRVLSPTSALESQGHAANGIEQEAEGRMPARERPLAGSMDAIELLPVSRWTG